MKTLHSNNVYLSLADNLSLPVNDGNGKHDTYQEILNSIDSQIVAMLSHHSKIIVIRIDLHLNEFSSNNESISTFVRVLRKRLKSKYKINRMGFVWVRELEKAKKQHYHFALILDANKVKHSAEVTKLAKAIWTGREFGHIPTIPKPYSIIHRGDHEAYQETFYRLSYLAKTRGKGVGKSGYARATAANDYSSSRIKIKEP